jgi:hypothetical protein
MSTVIAHVVTDDAGHAVRQVLRVFFSPSLVDWAAVDDGCIDGAGKTGHRGKVSAEGKSEIRGLRVADLPRFANDAEHNLVAFDRQRRRTFSGAGNVIGEDRNAEALSQSQTDRMKVHFVSIHPGFR